MYDDTLQFRYRTVCNGSSAGFLALARRRSIGFVRGERFGRFRYRKGSSCDSVIIRHVEQIFLECFFVVVSISIRVIWPKVDFRQVVFV